MYNFSGTYFVVDVGLYICSGKVQIHEDFIWKGRGPGWGGGGGVMVQMRVLKALRLELLLVDYLDKKEALMIKMEQGSGEGGLCETHG